MAPSDNLVRTVIKPLAWLPVIIINAIIVWSYFAYMVVFGFGKTPLMRYHVLRHRVLGPRQPNLEEKASCG